MKFLTDALFTFEPDQTAYEKHLPPLPMCHLVRFEGLRDVRIERRKRYPLNEVLLLTVTAVVSGYSEWEEIVDFGEEKLAWLRSYLPYAKILELKEALDFTGKM